MSPTIKQLRLSFPLTYNVYMHDDDIYKGLLLFFDKVHEVRDECSLEVISDDGFFKNFSKLKIQNALTEEKYNWSIEES